MSRRVQSTPAFFGVIVLCTGAVVCGCAAEETSFVPPAGGQGGSTPATTTPVYGTGGYTPYTPPVGSSTGGASVTQPGTGTGGVTGATTTKATGTGGTGSTTAAVTGTGGAVAATTAANPNEGTAVTFKAGRAEGAMSGYAYVAMGADDKVTSPTCGTAAAEITAAAPCASGTKWSSDTSLCITGNIPKLDKTLTDPYKTNWGMAIGVNATDPATGGLNQAHTSIALTFTGTPTSGLRAQVHIKGKSADYCYDAVTSGTAIPLTSFVTDCYNATPTGTKVTAADIPNIDKVSLQVNSADTAVSVADLCLTGITFK